MWRASGEENPDLGNRQRTRKSVSGDGQNYDVHAAGVNLPSWMWSVCRHRAGTGQSEAVEGASSEI